MTDSQGSGGEHQSTGERTKVPMRRWLASGGIFILLYVTAVLYLASPGGEMTGDKTSNTTISGILGPLTPNETFGQEILATEDQFSSVSATVGTYGGSADCLLRVELREVSKGSSGESVVADNDLECRSLPDSSPFKIIEFEPIQNSTDQRYELTIAVVDARDGASFVVWAGVPKGAASVAKFDAGHFADGLPTNPEKLSGMLRASYNPKPHVWDQITRILDRLDDFGPGWGTAGIFVCIIFITTILISGMPIALRSTKSLILLACLLALLRGLIWSASVPILEGMDEAAHVSYVQYVAENGSLPGMSSPEDGVLSDQLYATVDLMNQGATSPGNRPEFGDGAFNAVDEYLDPLSRDGGGYGPASAYPAAYYLGAVPFYKLANGDFLDSITFSRLWSIALGVVTAGLVVRIGRLLFPSSSLAQGGFVLAGIFQPMMAHQFAIVNNDAWVVLCGVAALSLGLAMTRYGRAPNLALIAGLVVGAGLLGKPFAIATAVPIGVGWLIGKYRDRNWTWRSAAGELGFGALGLAMTYGTWLLVARLLHIDSQKLPVGDGFVPSIREYLRAQVGEGGRAIEIMWSEQLWGSFGWARVPLPSGIIDAIMAIEYLILVAVVVWVAVFATERLRRIARLRNGFGRVAIDKPASDDCLPPNGIAKVLVSQDDHDSSREPTEGRYGRFAAWRATPLAGPIPVDARIAVSVAMVVGTIVALYAAGLLYYLSSGRNDLLQGRYALMAIPAILALPALLVEKFTKSSKASSWINITVGLAMVIISFIGMTVVWEAFYG